MIDLIVEVPEAPQWDVLARPDVAAAMRELNVYFARTATLIGTHPVGGRRLMLVASHVELASVQAAIELAELDWVIVGAAGQTELGRAWLITPDMTALLEFADPVPEYDAQGDVTGTRALTLEEAIGRQWHNFGRPWPAVEIPA